MFSPKTKYSLINAKQYFEEHLCAGDYYSESDRVLGQWLGNGAELLGLSGRVSVFEERDAPSGPHPSIVGPE
jgi:TrwC relaxase